MRNFLLKMVVGILICGYMPQLAAGQALKMQTKRALAELRKVTQAVTNRTATIDPGELTSLFGFAAEKHADLPQASEALIAALLAANNYNIRREQLQAMIDSGIERDQLGTILSRSASITRKLPPEEAAKLRLEGTLDELTKKEEALAYMYMLEDGLKAKGEVNIITVAMDLTRLIDFENMPMYLIIKMFEYGIDVNLITRNKSWMSNHKHLSNGKLADAIRNRPTPIPHELFMSMLRHAAKIALPPLHDIPDLNITKETQDYAGAMLIALLGRNGGKITKEQLQELMEIRELGKVKLGKYFLSVASVYKSATTLEALVDLDFLEVLSLNDVEEVAKKIGDLSLGLRAKLFERGINVDLAGKSSPTSTPAEEASVESVEAS